MSPSNPSSKRLYPLRMPPSWQPPYPSFMSEFDATQTDIVMAVIGCQFSSSEHALVLGLINQLMGILEQSGQTAHVDLSECERDKTGHKQLVITAYWLDASATEDFFATDAFQSFWQINSASNLNYGIYREVFNVPMAYFETLHSEPQHLVGIANARSGISEPINTHAYWGSMRDRIPESAHDAFIPEGKVEIIEQDDNRIVIRPNKNLAVIRSGQDLSQTIGKEQDEYYNNIEPVLKAGMAFLRDQGEAVNCFDCRFMTFIDPSGKQLKHTYGFACFHSLEDLEKWAEHHPTHLAIFNAFLEFAPGYGPDMRSQFWHEVSVLPANSQYAEYINCAPGTGLTAGLAHMDESKST